MTPELVKEVRARLDLGGFKHVEIMVSGGFTAERIRRFVRSAPPVTTFGVGTYIARSAPESLYL